MKPRIFPNVGLAFTHDSKLAKLIHYVNWTILELSGGSDQWVHWPLRDSPSYQHAWPTLNVTLCLPIIVQLLQQLLWSFSFSLHCMSLGCPCCLRTALSTKWSVMNSCWIVFFFSISLVCRLFSCQWLLSHPRFWGSRSSDWLIVLELFCVVIKTLNAKNNTVNY